MVDDSQKQILALIADMQREAYQKGWDDAVKKILAAEGAAGGVHGGLVLIELGVVKGV